MCISQGASLRAIVFVILSSIILLNNKEHKDQNKYLVYFFIFITLIQAIDYMIWRDLECNNTNRIAGIIGPILLNVQHIIPFILGYKLLNNRIFDDNNMIIINSIYMIYVLVKYNEYLNAGDFCTKLGKTNLDWAWNKHYNYIFYTIIMILNNINLINNKYVFLSFIISYIMLFFIVLDKDYSGKGEIWCYYATYILAIMYIIQKLEII